MANVNGGSLTLIALGILVAKALGVGAAAVATGAAGAAGVDLYNKAKDYVAKHPNASEAEVKGYVDASVAAAAPPAAN